MICGNDTEAILHGELCRALLDNREKCFLLDKKIFVFIIHLSILPSILHPSILNVDSITQSSP